ncbi:hypothetical protein GCM10010517_61090 [Streptosporangium fragile]|uniref:Uncharacterized protein n=1 Tax=Streptosporangium fragile TaxID=46186 RepID=A0ABN3W7V7_9ACTN
MVSAVALLPAMAGAGSRYLTRSSSVLSPPDGPRPDGGTFDVFLCEEEDIRKNCAKKRVTPEQIRVIERKLHALPQVQEVRLRSRAEVPVEIRDPAPGWEGECEGRGPVTQEEEAIEAEIVSVEGIERIYFGDSTHAERVLEHYARGTDLRLLAFSENSYIKLTDRKDARQVVDAVEQMAGVDEVEDMTTR